VAGIVNCLLMISPGLASSLPALMAALLAWGVAGGTLDVAQNAQGLQVEGEYGRPVMTSMHACYSFGAIVGALAGGGLAWAGVGLLPSLAVAGLTGVVIDATTCRWLLTGTHHPPPREPSIDAAAPGNEPIARGQRGAHAHVAASAHHDGPQRQASPGTPAYDGGPQHRTPPDAPAHDGGPLRQTPHGATAPGDDPIGAVGHGAGADLALGVTAPLGESHGAEADPALRATAPPSGGGDGRLERRRVRRAIIAIGVLGICAMVGEGSIGDWSAVYLKDNLGTSAGFAALGFAAFSATMTIGRALGDRLIQRFGVVPLIRACGAVATAGLAIGLLTAIPVLAVAGFAIFGIGLSAIVPQVFAAGGRADPAHPGSGVAKVVGFGYAGLSAGPAVIGSLASRIGLRAALVVPVLLALWVAVGASALRSRPAAPVPR
jgi:fucose permease